METWATFSVLDHRTPVFRQALALFDRIVVPVPAQPILDQTPEELLQLAADVEYLAGENAAVLRAWSSETFADWRAPYLAQALSAGINRDAFHDTRLMIADELGTPDVEAVPVYGGRERYDEARKTLMQVEEAVTLEIMQRLPIPAPDTPLQNLVALRGDPAFRTALENLLDWKRLQVPAIVLGQDRQQAIATAMRDFDKLTLAYARAMESAGYDKVGIVSSMIFSAIRLDIPGVIKDGLVSLRAVREPSWKKVSELKCAPGGVIYHFGRAVGAPTGRGRARR